MHSRLLRSRPLAGIASVMLALAAAVTGGGRAAAAPTAAGTACQNWTGTQPPSPGNSSDTLNSVAVISTCDGSSPSDVWAVGDFASGPKQKPLIRHWNGRLWRRVTIPDLPGAGLIGVRPVSGTDAWAVGTLDTGTAVKSLILHWDGRAWKQVASPSPDRVTELSAVAAVSRTDAWAVGFSQPNGIGPNKTLILHWDGHLWRQVPSPKTGASSQLSGVGVISATNAFAVGTSIETSSQTLALHWNGRRWTRVKTPDPGGTGVDNSLNGVTATGASNAWAVGSTGTHSLILRWNGSAWALVRSPNQENSSQFFGVAAVSASNAWAVGSSNDGTNDHAFAAHLGAANGACESWNGSQPPSPGMDGEELNAVAVLSPCNAWTVGSFEDRTGTQTLIEHWNGATWTKVRSPNPGDADRNLDGMTALSPTDIWAVGSYVDAGDGKTMILHWNGHHWSLVTSPNGSANSELSAVSATGPGNAWAVGSYQPGDNTVKTLIEHWDGRSWRRVPSPNPSQKNLLNSIAVTSASNAWAAGEVESKSSERALILHWNGHRWGTAVTPAGADSFLISLAATSASDAWAVGGSFTGSTGRSVILHWTGGAWKRVASPHLGGAKGRDTLDSITAISAANLWAVGSYDNGDSAKSKVLILHWSGRSWRSVTGPQFGVDDELFAVAASSASNIWTTGNASDPSKNLAFHCC